MEGEAQFRPFFFWLVKILKRPTSARVSLLGALRIIDPEPADVGRAINRIAAEQLDWASMGSDSRDWVEKVLAL